jgi:pimeloyl-ACP methyl ester carboxylesterase
MGQKRVRIGVAIIATAAVLAIGGALTFVDDGGGAGARPSTERFNFNRVRPVVFVHGFFGSGAQFESQALRFTSNGYPASAIATHDYDSLFGVETRDAVFTRLDARIASLLQASRADKVDLLGHSLGTALMQQYLNSSPARASRVAHYVNLDGSPAAMPPGGVPTLAIWGRGSAQRKIVGAANIYLTGQTHVQVVSSPETFEEIYSFFTGREPNTTEVVPEGRETVQLAGRAVYFPQNTGVPDGTLDIYEIDGATGARVDSRPEASYPLNGEGAWGPFNARARQNYEFAIVRAGASTHHLYYEPFIRSDYGIRLLTSPPTGGISSYIQRSDRHAALTITRNKEFIGDAGANGDSLEINGVNILNAANSPISKLAIGVFAFDAGSDGATNVNAPIPGLSSLPFLTGVDVFVPAATPANGTISIASTPRGGGGQVEIVNVPNWASTTDSISVQLNDYIRR